MQFELTEALLDDILFSMEDQEGDFYIDCQEGIVVNGDDVFEFLDDDHDNRFIDLPNWDSSSGFRLMERFAAVLRNPLIRNELSAALNQGKGVFRAFKNTLNAYPEVEKLWFAFKEREMKREIIRWYNAFREEWGLARIGLEPEETLDLLLEDFRFRPLRDDERAKAAELHTECMRDIYEFTDKPHVEPLSLMAETGSGDFAGYISAEKQNSAVFIRALEIKPEYRGLGIAKALLSHFLESINDPGIRQIYIDLPAEAEGFSRALIREHFVPCMTRYRLEPQKVF